MTVVIQKQMEFDRSLGPTAFSPGEKNNQLTKKARAMYHTLRLPRCLGIRFFVAKRRSSERRTLSISFFSIRIWKRMSDFEYLTGVGGFAVLRWLFPEYRIMNCFHTKWRRRHEASYL
jgi:hypothetical protein